jgi:hypothetical protein
LGLVFRPGAPIDCDVYQQDYRDTRRNWAKRQIKVNKITTIMHASARVIVKTRNNVFLSGPEALTVGYIWGPYMGDVLGGWKAHVCVKCAIKYTSDSKTNTNKRKKRKIENPYISIDFFENAAFSRYGKKYRILVILLLGTEESPLFQNSTDIYELSGLARADMARVPIDLSVLNL